MPQVRRRVQKASRTEAGFDDQRALLFVAPLRINLQPVNENRAKFSRSFAGSEIITAEISYPGAYK
jgi:hypothetical protein